MPKAKKIFLLHERRETWRVKFGKKRRAFFCDRCQRETVWLTGAEATLISDLSEREIFRLAENEKIHFREIGDGVLWICQKSLEEIWNRESGE